MHLKRIRLYGFKSFSQDTSLEFEPGVTALVGPNGGGKSNVVDAIRWALGEQRLKDLRAERWEDLINQGGPGRPAARLAEVTLEFDNNDGEMPHWPESLSVSRRYYRSGDSEYLVNGQSVRLKDVTDLFLDSGLGRFSYAIISQGRVEGALLQKPSDRLEQLEEAAGVSRYKVRKRETVAHLKETEDKLVRLGDLSEEVGRQMDEVRERADTEARYRTWEMLRNDWQNRLNLTEYRRAMDKRQRLEEQLSRLSLERRDLAEELTSLLSEATGLRQTVQQESALLEQEANQLKAKNQQETALRMALSETDSRLAQNVREQAMLEESITVLTAQKEDLGREAPASAAEPDLELTARADHIRVRLQSQIQKCAALAEERRQAEQALAAMGEERHRLEQQLARLQGILRLSQPNQNLADALRARDLESQDLEQRVRQLTDETAHLTEERTRLRGFAEKLDQEVYSLKHQLAGRQARLRALHQLDAEGEGLHAGVRAVLRGQQQGKISGVLGTLASLVLSPPDLMLAIETALGGAQQDLVMENEVSAREAVRYLKSGSLGRATFLPLDTVRPARPSGDDYRRLGREAGVVGWAQDLVQADSAMAAAVQHVLGRVLIVQNLEDASRLGGLHQFRYKMVTLDGQVVHAGGAITGGSRNSDNRNAVAQRKIELDELTRRIREDGEVVAAKEDLLRTTRQEVEEVEQKLDGARELLAEHRHRWQELRRGIEAEQELGDPDALMAEMTQLESLALSARSALQQLTEQETGAGADLASLEQEAGQTEALVREHDQAMREHSLIQTRIAQEIQRLDDQQDSQRARIAVLQREQEKLGVDRQKAAQKLSEATEEAKIFESNRAERIKGLNGQRERLGALENRQRVLELEDRKMEQKSHTWNQERLEIEVRFEAYVPPSNVEPLSRVDEDNARREVQRITQSLSDMGPVVPGSLAVFEQLRERQEFLQRESQDVADARRDLLATLKEIDEEMDRRVKETALKVEHAFSEACRQLYGGGEGGFSWTEGDQPGVELWVRPVGKRPSHLALLSGGEKALGGIAWLFSLLSVRPSPFVVLDEVEASLDEANAVRFSHYIQLAGGTTQYVIVTHQRQTMEAADALWGIAGDGHGQSRLVSVRLSDVDERVSS